MNRYKEAFSKYTSEHLLEKRALGDELTDEAHEAIEEIFAERGEVLPARPTQPINIKARRKSTHSKTQIALSWLGIAVVVVVAKALAHTWLGVLLSVVFVGYLIFDWLRKRGLNEDELTAEQYEKDIENNALNELMVACAEGNVGRAKELIEYGTDVDLRSLNGSTALMYAARNNHIEVVKLLVNAGANVAAMNDKKSTALSIAKSFDNKEVINFLSLHAAA